MKNSKFLKYKERALDLGYLIEEFSGTTHGYSQIVCTVCGEKTKGRLDNLFSGFKPCRCSDRALYRSEDDVLNALIVASNFENIEKLEVLEFNGGMSVVSVHFVCGTVENRTLANITKSAAIGALRPKKTIEQLVAKVKDGHTLCIDKGTRKLFKCHKHGELYRLRMVDHVKNAGCKQCQSEYRSKVRSTPVEVALATLTEASPDYHFDMSTYNNQGSKIRMTCPMGHSFMQTVQGHIGGNRCPDCTNYGFRQSECASFYVIRIQLEGATILKYGITNRGVEKRLESIVRKSKCKSSDVIVDVKALGSSCLEMERYVKARVTPVVTKEQFPDGYTETCEDSEDSWKVIHAAIAENNEDPKLIGVKYD